MNERVGLTVLGSGSSGNCTLVHIGDEAVMIDAGFSLKEIRRRLESVGLSKLNVRGILVTHEHDDHVKGLRVCSNYFKAPVFSTAACAETLRQHDQKLGQMIRITPGGRFQLAGFTITPFSIPHDARDPVAYVVYRDTVKIGVATDIGYASSGVEYELRNCNSLLLESNHDIQMLAASSRPWTLKQRILGRTGHLSNETCAELICRIVGATTKNIILGHVSRECNSEDCVRQKGLEALAAIGRNDIHLEIARQDQPIQTIWN